MHMINDKGEAVYFNPIRKNGKDQWLIQGIGSQPIYRLRRESHQSSGSQYARRLPQLFISNIFRITDSHHPGLHISVSPFITMKVQRSGAELCENGVTK